MKLQFYALALTALFYGCGQQNAQKTYLPKDLSGKEDFNQYAKKPADSIVVFKAAMGEKSADAEEAKERLSVKFRDTLINIQTSASDTKSAASQFALAEFLNTQKTSLLVQVADNSGLVAPFYLITLNEGQLDVLSLYRASKGKEDSRFTRGLERIGRSGYLINNDYFVTTVNAKVYPLKRKNPEQRIQGLHLLNSADKKTFVFLTANSLYQVNYSSGATFDQALTAKLPVDRQAVYSYIQRNYSWKKEASGESFLKADADDNRIVDIREFN